MRLHPGVAIAAWLLAVAGFVVMAVFAAAHDTFPADLWLTHRLQEIDSSALASVLNWTEDLARVPLVFLLTLLFAAGFLVLAGPGAGMLVLATALARPFNSAMKEVVERPRPSPGLAPAEQQPGDFSFPSGHANTALVLYGLIIYLAAVYVPNPWLRVPLQGFCLWVIIGNGIQRVYVGHHWPSDVLGGYYLGALVLAVLIAVERGVLRPLRPGQGRSFLRMKTGVGDGR